MNNDMDCGNLFLTRLEGQSIIIGGHVTITVQKIEMGTHAPRIVLSIKAPKCISVHRDEIQHRILKEVNGNVA